MLCWRALQPLDAHTHEAKSLSLRNYTSAMVMVSVGLAKNNMTVTLVSSIITLNQAI